LETRQSSTYNLGSSTGFSVNQVIEMARKVTGRPIPTQVETRRAGDPAVLLASSEKARRELGWKPHYDSLESIIQSAWAFHQTHPEGVQD
jgi:UDP-glucose 4-epimerase